MYRFFLFVKGYYLITVEGLLAERFINLCKVKNIYLWDLQNSNNIYRMKISIEDYNILDDIMNKTGVKVDILEKYGLPFLFLGKKNRIFYLYFVLLALMLVFVSNLFVWKIDFLAWFTTSNYDLSNSLNTPNPRPLCVKGAPAKRVGDCRCPLFYNPSVRLRRPPPFAQGRLCDMRWNK